MYNIEFEHRKGMLHNVPDALLRVWEGTQELAAIATATADDSWYQGSNIEKNLKKYPDWKVLNCSLYAHRPNKTVDPLPDMDTWKLVLPEVDREKALA